MKIELEIDSKPNEALSGEQMDRVVIAAAVAALYGEGATVRRIRPAGPRASGAWLRQGRLAIQESHATGPALVCFAPVRERGDL